MTESAIIGAVVSVLGTIATLLVAAMTQRGNLRQANAEHTASPYDKLAARVVTLEERVAVFEADLARAEALTHVAVDYAWILRQHINTQQPPPPPDWPSTLAEFTGVPI